MAVMATNVGEFNCVLLSPFTPVPATVVQVPEEVHNCTRWFHVSVIK